MRTLNRGPRDSLIYGLLWGLAVWLLESTAFALTRERLSSSWPMLLTLAIFWCTRGAALAWTTNWLAAHLRPAQAWALFPLLALLLSLAWDGSDQMAAVSLRLFRVDLPHTGQFLFTLWPMLIYGAPLFAFCLSDARARQVRALLAQAEAARVQNVTAIDAARFELLSRRIDPTLLLRSLEAVHQAVASGDARAGAHLDALVDFLRAAMPAVRGAAASAPVAGMYLKRGGSDGR